MSDVHEHIRSEQQQQRIPITAKSEVKLLWFVTAYGTIVVALHLFGGLKPSALLWGVDLFAFLDPSLKVLLLVLMAAMLLPAFQNILLRLASVSVDGFTRLSKVARVSIGCMACAALVFAFWFGREKVFLLGDGNLVIRLVRDMRTVSDIPAFFRNEPLAGYLLWRVHQIMSMIGLSDNEEAAIQTVSIVCALFSILVMIRIGRDFGRDPLERFFIAASLLVLGTSQFFFGYVEVYPPLFLTFLLFVRMSCLYLRGSAGLLYPSLLFALLVTFHFGMLCMTPAVFVLWYRGMKNNSVSAVFVSVIAALSLAGLLLFLCGYSPATFLAAMSGREKHLLPLASLSAYWSAYGFLSIPHVVDAANLQLLLFPFALAVAVATAVMYRHPASDKAAWWFLLLIAVCGLIFMLIANSEIGVSRDWDVYATFVSGIALFTTFLIISSPIPHIIRQRIFLITIGITGLHTIGWVTVNAKEESALLRFKELPDSYLWGIHAHVSAYEEMAIFYRAKHDLPNALDCYYRYLALDSTQGRIYAAVAHLEELAGDKNQQMLYDEKAIAHGVTYPDVYFDLAKLYVLKNRLGDARAVLKCGVEMNPESPLANEYLGTFLMTYDRAYDDALLYFQKMISIDSSAVGALYNAGLCAYRLKNYPLMKFYFGRFLILNPDRRVATQVDEILRSAPN